MQHLSKIRNLKPAIYNLIKGGGVNDRGFCKYYLDPNTGEKKALVDEVSHK